MNLFNPLRGFESQKKNVKQKNQKKMKTARQSMNFKNNITIAQNRWEIRKNAITVR